MSNSPTADNQFTDDKFHPVEAWCDQSFLHAKLRSGQIISVPVWWYPRLLNATLAQRNTLWLSPSGIHWEEIDEDISIEGMMQGRKAPGATPPVIEAAE